MFSLVGAELGFRFPFTIFELCCEIGDRANRLKLEALVEGLVESEGYGEEGGESDMKK